MLTHVAIAMLGAGIFLRIVGKEKNRRQRHLIARLIELKRLDEEKQQLLAVKEVIEKVAENPGPAASEADRQAA